LLKLLGRKLLTDEELHVLHIEQWLRKNGGSIARNNHAFSIQYAQWGHTIHASLRRKTSDTAVFAQVVVNREYHPLLTWVQHFGTFAPKVMVDAGANIGLTSLQLLSAFPDARLLAIEADQDNAVQLEHNLKSSFPSRWQVAHRALWSSEVPLNLSNSFRDAQAWSRNVTEAGTAQGTVQGITPSGLLALAGGRVDLLKIDIEGAESRFFSADAAPQTLLEVTSFLAMELHEEVGFTQAMEQLLHFHGFTFFYVGESIMAANLRRLSGFVL
jgi:FkbM family methyltransferase